MKLLLDLVIGQSLVLGKTYAGSIDDSVELSLSLVSLSLSSLYCYLYDGLGQVSASGYMAIPRQFLLLYGGQLSIFHSVDQHKIQLLTLLEISTSSGCI